MMGVLPDGATHSIGCRLIYGMHASREGEGGGTNFDVITRLRDGATWQQADPQINRAWSAPHHAL